MLVFLVGFNINLRRFDNYTKVMFNDHMARWQKFFPSLLFGNNNKLNIFPEPMIHIFILKFVAHNTAMKLFKVCDAILPSYPTILLSFEAVRKAASLARGPF